MQTLLVIKAHPQTDTSNSLAVADEFIKTYQQTHPKDQIITYDLYDPEGVPALNELTLSAWKKKKVGKPLSKEEDQLLSRHQAWLKDFIHADKYLFVNPMYNHFLPAELKQYLDLTAVAHKTFKYTSNGSVGLLQGKKAMHIQAAGDIYHEQPLKRTVRFLWQKLTKGSSNISCLLTDLGSLYLTNMLNFYGVKDISSIYVEGADKYPKKRAEILANALKNAKIEAEKF
ncbi:FMN-dependent NADH-azoreductase [Ligilactobacillus apodemi]|uniref:FMN dependent NADH:quinone oxidoreductase n=1 Tax=Ligilactobacillus apodemi DSM 16634 = JCM 16172 TaxID=1423724 RepID=A0A0R1U1N1_9LACO|nr:NAD(P)H-dependent oxidoreductase [Ligilactobacillus apodemi]KRL87261.1 FMN-dependent NADH-azoreductase 2 [Ligilactobacillus apodemi DSM 16634 = JCM 16172]